MTDFGEFSKTDKVHAIRMTLSLGHERQYTDNPFFQRGIHILALVLVDMVESLAKHSEDDLETHQLIIKEHEERKIYDDQERKASVSDIALEDDSLDRISDD